MQRRGTELYHNDNNNVLVYNPYTYKTIVHVFQPCTPRGLLALEEQGRTALQPLTLVLTTRYVQSRYYPVSLTARVDRQRDNLLLIVSIRCVLKRRRIFWHRFMTWECSSRFSFFHPGLHSVTSCYQITQVLQSQLESGFSVTSLKIYFIMLKCNYLHIPKNGLAKLWFHFVDFMGSVTLYYVAAQYRSISKLHILS